MSEFLQIALKSYKDTRGTLTVAQDDIPFKIKRCYWITEANSQIRGGHRHHVTRQFLVAIHGEVHIYMNDGVKDAEIILNNPSIGLLVEPEDWHTMHFHAGAILLVISSHDYDPSDYIDEKY